MNRFLLLVAAAAMMVAPGFGRRYYGYVDRFL